MTDSTTSIISIIISNDHMRLGPDATRDDLVKYAENLSEDLSTEFNSRVIVRLGCTDKYRIDKGDRPASDLEWEVMARLKQIESGDEWLAYLGD